MPPKAQDEASLIDRRIGERIRNRRWVMGLTQRELGEKLGIRPQQIQKYEAGASRISASRLWQVANALETEVSDFFEDTTGQTGSLIGQGVNALDEREAMVLARAYSAVPEAHRRLVIDLARALGEGPEQPAPPVRRRP